MIKFIVPSVGVSGLVFSHDHHVKSDTAFESVLESIRTIGGHNILKSHQLPTLGIHLSKDVKSRVHQFKSEEDWTRVKEEWIKELSKKKDEAVAEVVLPKGVSLFLHAFS